MSAYTHTYTRIDRQIIGAASHVKDVYPLRCHGNSLSLSPPPSLSSLSLTLSSSPGLRLPHGFLCRPLPHRYKRREACSFMHSASQLSEERGRGEGGREGDRDKMRGEDEEEEEAFLPVMNRSPVLHH